MMNEVWSCLNKNSWHRVSSIKNEVWNVHSAQDKFSNDIVHVTWYNVVVLMKEELHYVKI